MKRIAKALGQFKEISPEEMQSAGAQALRHLGVQGAEHILSERPSVRPARRWQWPAVAAIAAAIVIAVLVPTRIVQSAPAVLEDASGSRKIQFGEIVRPSGDKSATLSMADGSRVEARPQSEFSLERAEDGGTRIRLNRGSVAVMAAVGEVRVQQGTTEMRLRPGEQAETPLKERLAFELASIRVSAPAIVGGGERGLGGLSGGTEGCAPNLSGYREQVDPRRFAVSRTTLLELVARGWSYGLPNSPVEDGRDGAAYAYPAALQCEFLAKKGLLFLGSPDWARKQLWSVEAAISEGTFVSTPNPDDPKLQQMVQSLLTERFKVVVRREIREVPVYLLKVGKNGPKFNGKLEPRMMKADDGTPIGPQKQPDRGIFTGDGTLQAFSTSMASWTSAMNSTQFDRLIVDRTGLTGKYDFHFSPDPPMPQKQGKVYLYRETVRAMGLELEEARVPLEVLVLVSAEKPSEN